jgi:hypothetical protein
MTMALLVAPRGLSALLRDGLLFCLLLVSCLFPAFPAIILLRSSHWLVVDFSMEREKLSAMAHTLSLSLLSFSYHLLGSICECCLNAKGTAKDEPVQEI